MEVGIISLWKFLRELVLCPDTALAQMDMLLVLAANMTTVIILFGHRLNMNSHFTTDLCR